jgi:hypothetical protein
MHCWHCKGLNGLCACKLCAKPSEAHCWPDGFVDCYVYAVYTGPNTMRPHRFLGVFSVRFSAEKSQIHSFLDQRKRRGSGDSLPRPFNLRLAAQFQVRVSRVKVLVTDPQKLVKSLS